MTLLSQLKITELLTQKIILIKLKTPQEQNGPL